MPGVVYNFEELQGRVGVPVARAGQLSMLRVGLRNGQEVGPRKARSPAVLHQVLHDPVQHLLDERCAYPYVFQGLWAEGRGLPTSRALSAQGFLVTHQGFPAKRGGLRECESPGLSPRLVHWERSLVP